MNQQHITDKRQLLSNLFEGKTDSLRTYKASRQRAESPYRWIIQDETAGTVYGMGKDGNQHLLTTDELAKAPPNIFIKIIDHSGGKPIPEPDEDYYSTAEL
jgi:hypothetical protein